MNYSVVKESLDSLTSYRQAETISLKWEPLFVLPEWLEVWLQVFAPDVEPTVLTVRVDDSIIGLAPLLIRDGVASIIGSPDVCDYCDFPVVPGREDEFYRELLAYLKSDGVKALEPGIVRPDSTIMTNLVPFALQHGFEVSCQPDEVSPEMELPSDWDEYLQSLNKKQRHEVRRKIRRLNEAGEIGYRLISEAKDVPEFTDMFLKMFVDSRQDKADFLTRQIETFFRSILSQMAEAGLLKATVLELDGKPIATLAAFHYHGTIFLYNCGYDPDYNYLSMGIVSKAMLIKDSIERGIKKFDFLKGAEPYKFYLGGKEVRLQKCRIGLV